MGLTRTEHAELILTPHISPKKIFPALSELCCLALNGGCLTQHANLYMLVSHRVGSSEDQSSETRQSTYRRQTVPEQTFNLLRGNARSGGRAMMLSRDVIKGREGAPEEWGV